MLHIGIDKGGFTGPRFAGQKHVWEVTDLLQKGAKNIHANDEQDAADAARVFMYSIPYRFLSEDAISVPSGVAHIRSGARGVVGLLIGLPEMKPKYPAARLEREIRRQMLLSTLAQLHEDPSRSDHTLWTTPRGGTLDLLLFDHQLLQRAEPILRQIATREESDWKLNAVMWQVGMEEALRREGVTEPNLAQQLADRAADERQQRYFDAVSSSIALNEIAMGFGRNLARHLRATRIAVSAQQAHDAVILQRRTELTRTLQQSDPIKSRIPEWLEEQLSIQMAPFEAALTSNPRRVAMQGLRAAGLDAEAWLMEENLEFLVHHGGPIHAGLAQERVPARTFTWDYRFWNAADWKIERKAEPGPYGTTTSVCTADRYRHAEVTTRYPFWRLGNLVHRSITSANNSARWLLMDNLWNGPMGLRSLAGQEAFQAQMRVNPISCELEPDPDSQTATLRSRLKALWEDVKRSRQESEAQPDTGLIGKSFTRVLSQFWNYGWKGGGGTVLIGAGQPMLTAFNLGVTLTLVATSVGWAPLFAMLVLHFNQMFMDTESPGDVWFAPMLAYGLGYLWIAGVGQVAFSVVDGLLFQPGVVALGAVVSGSRKGAQSLHDSIAYHLIIRRLARVPARDTLAARRLEGPGLSSQIFYQIKPELALVALAAQLEKEELDQYEAARLRELDVPVNAYVGFMRDVLGPLAATVAREYPHALGASNTTHRRNLSDAVGNRRQRLDELLEIPERQRIKLTRDDLQQTLTQALAMVKQAFQMRVWLQVTPDDRARLWSQRNLVEEDWLGLTKQLLARTFSEALLEPLQDSDATLKITVQHAALQRFFSAVEHGKGPGDDLTKIVIPPRPAKMAAQPTRPIVTHEALSFIAESHWQDERAEGRSEASYSYDPWDSDEPVKNLDNDPQWLIRPLGVGLTLDGFLRTRGLTRVEHPSDKLGRP